MAADAEAYDANAEAPRATTDHSPRVLFGAPPTARLLFTGAARDARRAARAVHAGARPVSERIEG